jgi:hypothetical protein
MKCTIRRRLAAALAMVGAVVTLAAGCTAPPSAGPSPQASSSTANSPTSGPASDIDARLMGLGTSDVWDWDLRDSMITRDFQQFDLRRLDESEIPRACNGCGDPPSTAIVTVFAPGKFDATEAGKGQPVDINGNEGFFRASVGVEDAVLSWQYAENAWARVEGRAPGTSELNRMVELAKDIHPAERTAVRFPFSPGNVPANMPLQSIRIQHGHYPTILSFEACQPAAYHVPAPACAGSRASLDIQILPADRYPGYVFENGRRRDTYSIPVKIGGKDGNYDDRRGGAAVQVQPGLLVVFELSGIPASPQGTESTTPLEGILSSVQWATDPNDEATWPAVTDWAK